MNSLHLYLIIGLGVVGLIVLAVIWSLKRMPSEAELDEMHRHQQAQATLGNAASGAPAADEAGAPSSKG